MLERTEYIDLVADCLEHLDPSIVIHRVTGDGPKDLLIAPLWASRKREVLNLLHHRLKERQSFQGKALERWVWEKGLSWQDVRQQIWWGVLSD